MGLLGILAGLLVLMVLAFRGWSVLLLAPLAALVAAAFSGQPLLASWTQTFMTAASGFVAQFFPLFMLGALFGKLMADSGSVDAIAEAMTRVLGPQRAVLAVVLAGALVTYGGVSLFVAFFVLVPMAMKLFQAGEVPRRLIPAAIALGTTTFTMSALPGTPAVQNAIPMPFFGTTAFAAPGLGLIASAIMLGWGLFWLGREVSAARARGEGHGASGDAAPAPDGDGTQPAALAPAMTTRPARIGDNDVVREKAANAAPFDVTELERGQASEARPSVGVALLPLGVVVLVNLLMSFVVLPRLDTSYLSDPRWGGVALPAVGGVWSIIVALLAAIGTLVACNVTRLRGLRATMDAGVNAAALPILSVASLVGFGAVVASLPAFEAVSEWVLGIGHGNPLASLAVATTVLSSLTGSASGGMSIALGALGETYMQQAQLIGLSPQALHRVSVIAAGTLDTLPHNGAIVTLLTLCGLTHRHSYRDIVMVGVIGPVLALVSLVVLASLFGAF